MYQNKNNYELGEKNQVHIVRDSFFLFYVYAMKKVISTEKAPKAIGPYSQAIEKNGFLFLSGQIPLNPLTGEVVSDAIEDQVYQVFENISAVLQAADYTFDDIVKTTVFLTDMNNFSVVNSIYSNYFNSDFPARSAVAVRSLPKGVLVEIEVIAVK